MVGWVVSWVIGWVVVSFVGLFVERKPHVFQASLKLNL